MSDKKLIKEKSFFKRIITERFESSKKNCVSEGIYRESPKHRRIFNKKGSSLVLAMVAISLIAILSTLVLSLSLNAYKASVQNKWADEDFYYCEECLEDVYGIVVSSTNDIFLDNYKKVLTMFTNAEPDVINKEFREGIHKDLRSVETNSGSSVYLALRRDIDATDDDGNVIGNVRVSYDWMRYSLGTSYEEDLKSGKFVFKNVNVEFRNSSRTMAEENQRNFYSSVTTDIVIYIPNLVPAVETDTKGSLDYVIVSGENTVFSGSSTIKGNVYAGTDFEIGNNANISMLSDYVTVCNELKNNGKLLVSGLSATANLWCKNLVLKENASSSVFTGNMFVNDDTEINGKDCSVQIAGKYYGYGDGTSSTGYTGSKGEPWGSMNSAILVNGEGTLLDMVNIQELVLSGHSFFPVDGTKQYEGAESLATIVAQSIYMVDDDYIDFPNRRVSINGKYIDFADIKLEDGRNLIQLLTEDGFTLVTGGVDLDAANITVDDTRITESVFVNQYLDSGVFVTLGWYETNGEKYCSLYWDFKRGNTLQVAGADIVALDYVNGSKNISGVDFSDVELFSNGAKLMVNDEPVKFGTISSNNSITDAHGHVYNFSVEYGELIPAGIDLSTFKKDYLVESNPVNAVLIETESDEIGVFNYKAYLQWNFDPKKTANQNAGDKFISACIKAGLIDGFLEKFMDGGYIQIAPNASVGSVADLYEYMVGADGYIAKKFGSSSAPLFHSSVFTKNIAESYKWYMTTLIPEAYNPFGAFKPFDGDKLSEAGQIVFNNGDKYSIFKRNSYFNDASGVCQATKYMNFETISNILDGGWTIVESADGKYENLIIDGDLIVSGGIWTAGGSNVSPFLNGIIFVNGNVRIDSDIDFKGLIIANGKVEISAGNYTNDDKVLEGCLEALKSDRNVKWWSLVSDEYYTRKEDVDTGTSSLNAIDCIKYENWTRNRD